jgi:hypothetical protein
VVPNGLSCPHSNFPLRARLIAVAAFALAIATSAQAMSLAPLHQADGNFIYQSAYVVAADNEALDNPQVWSHPPEELYVFETCLAVQLHHVDR